MATTAKSKRQSTDAELSSGNVQIPSWYSQGWETEFEKAKPHDEKAARLQHEVLNTITKNRKDLEQLNKARTSAFKDPTNTLENAAVTTFEFSKQIQERIYERSHPMESRLHNYRNSIKAKIDVEIQRAVSDNRDPGRVQDYLLKLPNKSDRLAFVRQAINKGDLKTVSAVIEDHSYLSGLDDDDVASLREQFINQHYPEEVQTMQYVSKLAEIIGKGFQSTLENMETLNSPEVQRAINLRDQAKRSRTFEQ